MPTPQGGIIPAPSPNALFLVLRVLEPEKNGKAVAKIAASIPALTEKVGAADPRAKLVCKTLDIPEKMLKRMMGPSGDGLYDHLMDFSQAVSGANFFAPSLEVLKSLGRR